MMLDGRPVLTRLGRTFRRLAYVETTVVATFGEIPLVDTSHVPDDEYDDVMEARAQRVLSRRLRGPRAWFSLEQVGEQCVHVLGRKVVPWFRSPLMTFLVLIGPCWVWLSLEAPGAPGTS